MPSVPKPLQYGQPDFNADKHRALHNILLRTGRGVLGYAQMPGGQVGISTETDITNLTTTVTVEANRRIRISVIVGIQRTVADGICRIRIKEDGVTLSVIDGFVRGALEGAVSLPIWVTRIPAAGSHTYKATMERLTGTGTVQIDGNNVVCSILVEDIGAV